MSISRQEMIQKLRERNKRERKNWIPETAGEELTGEVIEVAEELGDFGVNQKVHIHTDEDPDTEWVVRCFGSVLAREMAIFGPMPGDIISIVYRGKGVVSKGKFAGKEFKNWTVSGIKANTPDGAGPNYAALQEEARAALKAEGVDVDNEYDNGVPFDAE